MTSLRVDTGNGSAADDLSGRRAMPAVTSGCSNLTYAERRTKLGLPTLELRRIYSDLIMCYKIVFGIVKLEIGEFFTFNTNISTHGHPYKLYVHHNRLNVRKQFFCVPCCKCME